MFWNLLDGDYKLRYQPNMTVTHNVEAWRIHRRYFLKLHYRGGVRYGRYRLDPKGALLGGVPRHLYRKALAESGRAVWQLLTRRPSYLRQAMNAAHTVGIMHGCRLRRRHESSVAA